MSFLKRWGQTFVGGVKGFATGGPKGAIAGGAKALVSSFVKKSKSVSMATQTTSGGTGLLKLSRRLRDKMALKIKRAKLDAARARKKTERSSFTQPSGEVTFGQRESFSFLQIAMLILVGGAVLIFGFTRR